MQEVNTLEALALRAEPVWPGAHQTSLAQDRIVPRKKEIIRRSRGRSDTGGIVGAWNPFTILRAEFNGGHIEQGLGLAPPVPSKRHGFRAP